MASENLGLFDSRPNRTEIRIGLAAVAVQFAAFLVILPWHDIRLGEVVAFVPVIDTAMCVGELIIATKLYAQGAIFRSRALTVLASGYAFGALLLIPHALTFPGAFATNGLLGGGLNTSAWLGYLNRLVLPTAVIAYVVIRAAESPAPKYHGPRPRTVEALAGAIALAVLVTLVATLGQNWLPPLLADKSRAIALSFVASASVGIAVTFAAMVLLIRQKKSVLDMWLLVALSSWVFLWALAIPASGRFTIGWYGRFGLQLVSSLVIMVALVAETNRLYAQLSVWAAARERQRETRLMSLDAVAAAFSHEVGQPLTAMNFSASAGLDSLTGERPDAGRAAQSLRDTLDGVRRAFEVLKSIRATFAGGWDSMSEFDLNELVRETASLMARELAVQKIDLRLKLDDSQPAIFANRIQIQRVLVNLLTNAVESILEAASRQRRIEIRSTAPDSETLLIEVSDTGAGIAPENISNIFDPFFTTKSAGTGLGLSLSSTIAAEHGGRLWASRRDGGGATFHLQLPRDPRISDKTEVRLAVTKGSTVAAMHAA